jgi:GNAT superfamily N-acetyltransferase
VIGEHLPGEESMIIREERKGDFSKLIEIMDKSATKKELRGFVPPTRETRKFLNQLKQQPRPAKHHVFVAEMNQEPVGFIYFTQKKDCFTIEELDVAEEHQGQGIGKALVKRVEGLARNKGMSYLTTGTAINSKGRPWKAYGFWSHIGYADTGERTDSGYGFRYCKLVKKLR